MVDKQRLTVPGHYSEVKRICRFVSQGAASVGLDETAVFHIELACDEASTNIIEHAYKEQDKGSIQISWHVADNMFIVIIHDSGPRFIPDDASTHRTVENAADPDDIDNIQVGGLGIHFMRTLMDEVTFSYDPQHGNKLVMKKRIG